jgi:quercetin dioxygenase-like cupin family protein
MTKIMGFLALLISILVTEQAFCLGSHAGKEAKIQVTKIMDTEENIIGQKIVYPTGAAHITSEVIDVPPKTAIPWHEHLVPMYAYILEGEIEVDYGDKGTKTIKNGEAMIEAVNFPHKGINKTKKTAKILVVYVGAAGTELEKIIDRN